MTTTATLTALADLEPTTGNLTYEVHPDGGVFIPAQTALEVPRPLFESLALNIHRGTLEASPAEESDYYEQYTLAPDKVLGNTECNLSHDRDTNTVTAAYAVHAPMYLTGDAVSQYLKTVHLVIDHMGELVDPNRPVNAAAHLLEAADRIEEYAAETDSENLVDVAAHLFAQYLVIFSAREYQSDFTPVEYLKDAQLDKDDYKALEDAGLICPMWDAATGNLSSYHLTLFAGE
ncbi:hypothetical protein [Rothia nasisuis]|uniref:hypothetical protein n=1 Tax=Rothia nasisuis TaxID=2109647 RepID=UPI001F47B038|nr:hypothetical protein [Rothia nasisuis]